MGGVHQDHFQEVSSRPRPLEPARRRNRVASATRFFVVMPRTLDALGWGRGSAREGIRIGTSRARRRANTGSANEHLDAVGLAVSVGPALTAHAEAEGLALAVPEAAAVTRARPAPALALRIRAPGSGHIRCARTDPSPSGLGRRCTRTCHRGRRRCRYWSAYRPPTGPKLDCPDRDRRRRHRRYVFARSRGGGGERRNSGHRRFAIGENRWTRGGSSVSRQRADSLRPQVSERRSS